MKIIIVVVFAIQKIKSRWLKKNNKILLGIGIIINLFGKRKRERIVYIWKQK